MPTPLRVALVYDRQTPGDSHWHLGYQNPQDKTPDFGGSALVCCADPATELALADLGLLCSTAKSSTYRALKVCL